MRLLLTALAKFKNSLSKSKNQTEKLVIAALVILTSLVFVVISLVNHQRFLTFGWDLGFYDQIVWQYSKFTVPYSTFVDLPALGERFSPILVFFAPFYWLFADARVLLVGQALFAALAALPLYHLGKHLTKSTFVAFVISVSYLSFIGLQRAVFFDFHPDTLMPFFIALVLLFALLKKENLSLLFSFLLLLHKEWVGLLVAAIGIMFIIQKKKSLGVKTFLLGVVGFVFTIYGVILPLGGSQSQALNLGFLGKTPLDAAKYAIANPLTLLSKLINPFEKLVTAFSSFWPFAFLPLLAPSTLIPILAQFAVRFLDETHKQSWTLRFHYSASLAPLMAYGAAMGIGIVKRKKLANLVLLFTSILGMFVFHAPVFSLFKSSFYFEQQWIKNNREILALVPDDAAVAAQNNLAPHLSARKKIYSLPKVQDAEYLVVDFHENQSDYNFHTATQAQIEELVDELILREEFDIVAEKGKAMLLKRK